MLRWRGKSSGDVLVRLQVFLKRNTRKGTGGCDKFWVALKYNDRRNSDSGRKSAKVPKGRHLYNRRFQPPAGNRNIIRNRQISFSFPPGAYGAGRERKGTDSIKGVFRERFAVRRLKSTVIEMSSFQDEVQPRGLTHPGSPKSVCGLTRAKS